MKEIVLLTIAILSFGRGAFAQVDPVGQFNRHVVENWKGEYFRVSQYKVRGTPYLFGESFPGTLIFKGGVKTNTNILYDLYNQKAGAEVKNNILESDLQLDEFSLALTPNLGGSTLIFKRTDAYGDKLINSYFNVLEDGERAAFLKIFKIKLVSDPTNMMDKDLKIFEQYFEYYIYNKSNKLLNKIKLKEKDIIRQFGNDFFLKDFITKGNLDVSIELDAIKLLHAYNTKQ